MNDNDYKNSDRDGGFDPEVMFSSGRKSPLFSFIMKLVVIGIVVYISLNHIEKLWSALQWVYSLLSPLLVGALLAFVLNTPMSALERLLNWLSRKIDRGREHRRASAILALVLTFLLAFLLIYIIVNTIVPQFIEAVKSVFTQIQQNVPEYLAILDKLEGYGINTESVVEWLNSVDVNSIVQKVTDNLMNIIGTVANSASLILSGAVRVVSTVVFAVYLLANKKSLGRQMKKLAYAYLKKPFVDRSLEVSAMVSKTFSNFISGQCLDAVILGLMCFVAMTVFRFPYAMAICSLITVTAVIPYVGAFLGGAFGALLMIIDDPLQAILFIVLFIVVQQIDNHLVYPRVVGGSVGLPAIWTFAAVIVGAGLMGVVGMVMFIPLFSVFYTLIKSNVNKRLADRGIVIEHRDE